MRDTDPHDEAFQPLGPPLREPAKPVPPRHFNTDGTIIQRPDGKLETRIPPPPIPPSVWEMYLKKAKP